MAERRQGLSVEWLIFGVRWLLLFAVFLVTYLGFVPAGDFHLLSLVLIFGVCYELLLAVLLLFKAFPLPVAVISQFVDIGLLLAMFFAVGQASGPLFVLSALPVVGGGLRAGRGLGVTTAITLSLGYGVLLSIPRAALSPPILVSYGLTVLTLFGVAVLSTRQSQPGELMQVAVKQAKDEAARTREALDKLQTVYKLASTLSATLSYERVLDALLDISAIGFRELAGFEPDSPRMVLLFEARECLKVVASRHMLADEDGRTVLGQAGLIRDVLMSAEPMVTGGVSQDPELKGFTSFNKTRSVVCVPLRAGFESYGVVVFGSSAPDAYSQEHIDLISAFCNQAVMALENARMYRSLQQDKQRIIESQEESRRRLARELHDGPTQTISALAMRLSFTKLLAKREPAKAAAELDKLEDLARRTAKEIRMMLFTLRPVVLETQGLAAAVQQYADKLRESDSLPVTIDNSVQDRLPPEIEDIAFSIIEEAVNNARKHAQAKKITVHMRVQRGLFIVEIEDDGKGFDLSSVTKSYDQRGSLGLINMRERAALVEGNVEIHSTPGQGTTVALLVPVRSDLS